MRVGCSLDSSNKAERHVGRSRSLWFPVRSSLLIPAKTVVVDSARMQTLAARDVAVGLCVLGLTLTHSGIDAERAACRIVRSLSTEASVQP